MDCSSCSWSPKNVGYEKNAQVRPSTGYPDSKESYQVGFQRTDEQDALWPTEEDCPKFREETEEFMRKVQRLSVKVMELFAEGLGLVRFHRAHSLLSEVFTLARVAYSRPTPLPMEQSHPKARTRPTRCRLSGCSSTTTVRARTSVRVTCAPGAFGCGLGRRGDSDEANVTLAAQCTRRL